MTNMTLMILRFLESNLARSEPPDQLEPYFGEGVGSMASRDIGLMAHLMRRAGFGATYEELETRVAKGYEATVEELLHPEEQPDMEIDLLERFFSEWKEMSAIENNQAYWTYRMINTQRPLQEKIALFWHGILCVGVLT